jgi:hypothetical protein
LGGGNGKEALMKKFIFLFLTLILVLSAGSFLVPAWAQEPPKDEQPTFYRLTPGVYVNPWPRFTIAYPKDWLEEHRMPFEVFRAGSFGSSGWFTGLGVVIWVNPPPLEGTGKWLVDFFKHKGYEATLVSDKPTQLRDGTPARELEIWWRSNYRLRYAMYLITKIAGSGSMVAIGLFSGEKIGEDLRAILYSAQYQPDKDVPITVPPDVQEFFENFCSDLVSHGVEKVMTHYSDGYLFSGIRKKEEEQSLRTVIRTVRSCEIGITEFIPAGEKAYLAGFTRYGPGVESMLTSTVIIKENGRWKWYGNQRDSKAWQPK